MKQLKKWLLPVMFCIVLCSISILLFRPGKEYSATEKRYLTQRPVWSWEQVRSGAFQQQLEKWSADQFPGRDLWVSIHSYSQLLLGRNALQNVYLAENGYLIAEPASDTTELFEANLQRFERFAASCPVPVSFMMVPSGGWLMEELLPKDHLEYPDDVMYELAQKSEHMRVLDPRDALRHADAVKPVQYRTDHHLTSYGNFVLSKVWWESQGLAPVEEEAFEQETVEGFCGSAWSGSGYRLTKPETVELWDSGAPVTVTIEDPGKEPVVSDSVFFREHLKELDHYPVFLDGNHCRTMIENPQGTEGTLLILKDSYGHCFTTMLTQRYEKIILLDLRFYRGSVSDVVTEEGVDQVLILYGTSTLLTDTNSAWLS